MSKEKWLVVVLTGLLAVGGASAATLNVGSGQTYATIDAAYAAAVTGDTIEIHAGTYTSFPYLGGNDTGKENLTFTRSGEDKVVVDLGSEIFFRFQNNYTFDGLIFDGRDLTLSSIFDIRYDADYTTFRNDVFYGSGHAASREAIYVYGDGSNNSPVDHLIVENCTFYDNAYGIYAHRGSGWDSVKDNLFINNSIGIYSAGPTVNAQYSSFYGNTTDVSGAATKGTGTISVDPVFDSTAFADATFMYLDETSPSTITAGASDGSYMGARPQVPEPATLSLLAVGTVAGLLRKRRT